MLRVFVVLVTNHYGYVNERAHHKKVFVMNHCGYLTNHHDYAVNIKSLGTIVGRKDMNNYDFITNICGVVARGHTLCILSHKYFARLRLEIDFFSDFLAFYEKRCKKVERMG